MEDGLPQTLRCPEDFRKAIEDQLPQTQQPPSALYDLDPGLRRDDSGLSPGHFSSLSVWALSLATRALAPPLDRVEAKSERWVASWLIEPL